MAETFIQWVIEDDFCNARPAWERAGAEMVQSVHPYEEAKIRLLNAAHSAIAWGGTLRGHRFIHEGVADPLVREIAFEYATQDAIPCLRPSPLDLERYRDTVLDRFRNAALADTNERVAMDSYAKLQGFVAPTVRERLRRGESIDAVAMLPALYLAFLARWDRGGIGWAYADSMLDAASAHTLARSADRVAALCADPRLWSECANDVRFVEAVRRALLRAEALAVG
jgi:D-arabinitol 4-dehydrogenase